MSNTVKCFRCDGVDIEYDAICPCYHLCHGCGQEWIDDNNELTPEQYEKVLSWVKSLKSYDPRDHRIARKQDRAYSPKSVMKVVRLVVKAGKK